MSHERQAAVEAGEVIDLAVWATCRVRIPARPAGRSADAAAASVN